MKVMHVVNPSGLYGTERVILDQAKRLSAVDLSLAYFDRRSQACGEFVARMAGFGPVFPLRPGLKGLPASAWEFMSAIDQARPQVLHCHGYKPVALAWSLKRLHRLPIVVTQHGFVTNSPKTRLYNWIDVTLCASRGVDLVICVSKDIRERFLRAGVNPGKLVLLPNGVETASLASSASLLPADLRPPAPDRPGQAQRRTRTIAWVGRLSQEKGPEVMLRAFARVSRERPGVRLVMVGDGPMRDELDRLARVLGLAPAGPDSGRDSGLVMTGFRTDAREIIAGADMLALSSRTEGTPMVLLEAMASGRPVVATRVGGVPELVRDGIEGLLVEPGDEDGLGLAIRRILDEAELAERLGRGGQARVAAQYDAANLARLVQDIYAAARAGIRLGDSPVAATGESIP